MSRSPSSTAGSSSTMKRGPLRRLDFGDCIARPTQTKLGSHCAGIGEPQPSAPGLHQRATDRQAEAEAFGLRAVEGPEQRRGDIRRNARPVVAHADLDLAAIGHPLDRDMNRATAPGYG